jgi:hypothetical protein
MRLPVVFVLAACSLLFACQQQQPYTINASFDPDEVAWSRVQGTATVRGQGFMRTLGGEIRTCQKATLVPFSKYTAEGNQFLQRTLGRIPIANPDPRAPAYARFATCDAQGNFAFRNLPQGSWFVRAIVTWEAGGNLGSQGGALSEPATTRTGETTEVIVTR